MADDVIRIGRYRVLVRVVCDRCGQEGGVTDPTVHDAEPDEGEIDSMSALCRCDCEDNVVLVVALTSASIMEAEAEPEPDRPRWPFQVLDGGIRAKELTGEASSSQDVGDACPGDQVPRLEVVPPGA